MIDEANIETDEGGFVLCLGGDFVGAVGRYLAGEDSTLYLRLPQDAAIQLLAQCEDVVGPWRAEMNFERAAYERATPEEREAVLGVSKPEVLETWPQDHPRYRRLWSLITDPEHAQPEPMIDARLLRIANGTASQQDRDEVARDQATIKLIRTMAAPRVS